MDTEVGAEPRASSAVPGGGLDAGWGAAPGGAGLPGAAGMPAPAAPPAAAAPAGQAQGWAAPPVPWQPAPWQQPPPSQPAPWQQPAPPTPSSPPAAAKAKSAAGGAAAGLFAVLKYGAVALKFGKFGPMVISMAVSVGALTLLYGWRFGVGLVALIFVHEMGHVMFAKAEGVQTTLPFFLGPFGALIALRSPLRDARQEAVIGIGGPVVGTLGAVVCAVLASDASGSTRLLLIALAYAGFFINLFNLTPIVPLDGGRVTRAVPAWLLVCGLAAIGWVVWASAQWGQGVNPIVVIVLIIAAISVFQRIVRRREETEYIATVPPGVRLMLGLSWIALIAVTGVGMSVAHSRLVDAGAISAPASDTSAPGGGGFGPGYVTGADVRIDADQLSSDIDRISRDCAQSSPDGTACLLATRSALGDAQVLLGDVDNDTQPLAGQQVSAVARLHDEVGSVVAALSAAQTAAERGAQQTADDEGANAARLYSAAVPDIDTLAAAG
jgi:Zn-dependent protease